MSNWLACTGVTPIVIATFRMCCTRRIGTILNLRVFTLTCGRIATVNRANVVVITVTVYINATINGVARFTGAGIVVIAVQWRLKAHPVQTRLDGTNRIVRTLG